MKVVALVSSPRKNSNSKMLAEAVLAGAKENGAETELITIVDKKINPCRADGSCKAPGSKGCGVKDDMQPIYQSILGADAVVFAMPVYFGRMNAPMFNIIDRLYGFLGPEGSRVPAGKKAASVITCGGGPVETMEGMHGQLMASLGYFGFADAGLVCLNGVNAEGDAANHPEKIAEAKELGKKLSA